MMTLEDFQHVAEPSGEWSAALRALWLDKKNRWDQAHREVQDDDGRDGAWVHAYLHRKEGDLSNAIYWYSRAGKEPHGGSHDVEWELIALTLLTERAT